MIYIKKNIQGFYIETTDLIDSEYYDGQIGETYEDFLDGKWVPLSSEQEIFHEENPSASVREVLAMELDPVETPDPIEVARKDKLNALTAYDKSSSINDFTVNGEIHAWFTPEMRSNYRNSIDAAKLLGVESLDVFIGDALVTLPTSSAEQMLAQIQMYADQCYIKTKQHEAAIRALDSMEDINNYDYTIGYPSKLNFVL